MFVDQSDQGFSPILVGLSYCQVIHFMSFSLGLQLYLYHGVKTAGNPLQDSDGDRVEKVEDEAEAVLGQVEEASVALPRRVRRVARRAVHHRVHPASVKH